MLAKDTMNSVDSMFFLILKAEQALPKTIQSMVLWSTCSLALFFPRTQDDCVFMPASERFPRMLLSRSEVLRQTKKIKEGVKGCAFKEEEEPLTSETFAKRSEGLRDAGACLGSFSRGSLA